MGATNHTPNIELPQFVDSDKPTWRGDINGAFADIDGKFGSVDGEIALLPSPANVATLIAAQHTTDVGLFTTPAAAAAAAAALITVQNTANNSLFVPLGKVHLGRRIAFFGDSITNYGEGYPYYAFLLSQGVFTSGGVYSHPGASSLALASFLAGDILALSPKPSACVCLDGANDADTGVSVADYRSRKITQVGLLRAAGIIPILATIPPNNDDTDNGFVKLYNAFLVDYADTAGIPIIDFYGLLVDTANGDWKTAYYTDGLHPSSAANKAMGQLVADTLIPFANSRPTLLQTTVGAPNEVANSNFLVDTNTDGIADGLSATPAAGFAYSVVADASTLFNWQRVTLSGAGVNRRQIIGAGATFTVGDRMRFAARVRTGQNNATIQNGTTLQITCYLAGYAGVTGNFILTSPGGGLSQQVDGISSVDFTVPAGTVIVTWTHLVGPDDGTYDVAQPTWYNLTTMGIA